MNKYVPDVDCNGEIDWTKPYIKNKEIKRMTVPYKDRKEYLRNYRQTHKEKFREYMREYYRRRKIRKIREMRDSIVREAA